MPVCATKVIDLYEQQISTRCGLSIQKMLSNCIELALFPLRLNTADN